MKADEKPSWGLVSPSGVAYHFGTSGLSVAVATAVTHPLDVLKVRLQMQLVGQKGPLTGMGRLFVQVLKNEGPTFLYLGLTPALTSSSTVAGLVSTLLTAPVDMIKTRLMLQQESERVGRYRNGFHCAYQVLRSEGPRGLYKGSLAMFARLGPQTTITFVVCEKLRELAGLKAI